MDLYPPLVLTSKFPKRPWPQPRSSSSVASAVCVLWLTGGLGVTLRRLRVAHLLPRIAEIQAGAKHLHQLFLVVGDVPLHDVHAGPQQPLERLHIHN